MTGPSIDRIYIDLKHTNENSNMSHFFLLRNLSSTLARVISNTTRCGRRHSTVIGARSSATAGPGCYQQRFFSSTAHDQDDDDDWNTQWAAEVDGIEYVDDHFASAEQLRGIVRRGLLRFTDLRDAPARFFEAHRQIAARSTELGPGFFIRFTVQYNLFAGTILGCAGTEQLPLLDEMQARGQLGCFALTEKFAGVNSGLVVNTEIEWDEGKGVFVLHTPNDGAKKNWISQGFTADKAVVIANLTVKGEGVGPHAFVMDFRDDAGAS